MMFMTEKKVKELEQKIEPYFDYYAGHGFDHTQRVYNMALNLAKNYKADIDVIKVASLLHDIARMKEDGEINICHAEEGAKMAKEILEEINFPSNKIPLVCDCIRKHRHSKEISPDTIEEKILQDADRLDALGALIISRCFEYGGNKGFRAYDPNIPPKKEKINVTKTTTINFFYEKTLRIKPENFNLKEAQKLARNRYKYVKNFINRFIKEWNGEL